MKWGMEMAAKWWEMETEDGEYYATLDRETVRIYLDDDLVATAPQTHETYGDYVVTLFDGTVIGKTNWLRSVVAITAQNLGSWK